MKMKFFNLAKRLSYKSDYHTHRLGAVIVRNNDVVGIGFNKRKTHPLSKTRFNNIHAELSAILNAGLESLEGCDIYVYRETRHGETAIARPCLHCLEMLKSLSVSRMYYTTGNGFSEEKVY
jgi:deoxycytidylate deaminase